MSSDWKTEFEAYLNGEETSSVTTVEAPEKTNAERIDDVIDMLDLATAGRGIDGECLDAARASAEVLRGEIQAGRA